MRSHSDTYALPTGEMRPSLTYALLWVGTWSRRAPSGHPTYAARCARAPTKGKAQERYPRLLTRDRIVEPAYGQPTDLYCPMFPRHNGGRECLRSSWY